MVHQSEQALRALGLPAAFTFALLHERIEQLRDRPVFLIPHELPALDLHGLWLATATADHIFYDRDASPLRRQATISHEFGHILFDHGEAAAVDLDELAGLLHPAEVPDPLTVRLRTDFHEHSERLAEVFATVVVDRLYQWSTPSAAAADSAMLDRLAATLERQPR